MAEITQTTPEWAKTKSLHDMTIAELQAEIGKLQRILEYKVCGDPNGSFGFSIDPSYVYRGIKP